MSDAAFVWNFRFFNSFVKFLQKVSVVNQSLSKMKVSIGSLFFLNFLGGEQPNDAREGKSEMCSFMLYLNQATAQSKLII